MAYIVSSGEISSGIILDYDSMTVLSGGTADNTTVNGDGYLYLFSGGTANSTTINYGGWLEADYGGFADWTTVNEGGVLTVYGFATEIVENGGYVYVEDDADVTFASNTFSGLTLTDSATVHSGTTATDITVNSYVRFEVYSGGIATEIKENGGYVYVEDDADITFADNSFSGLTLTDSATVHSGTTATDITINSGTGLEVYSGGIATEIKENGGYVYVEDGADVTFAANSFSGLTLTDSATVHSGTTAIDITVTRGRLVVFSGGIATEIKENGGYVFFEDDADVTFAANSFSGISLYDSDSATVHSGTTATEITVASRGKLEVYSGGTATKIRENGGYVFLEDGADVTFTANSFSLRILSAYESATVHSGTTANSITVKGRGVLEVYSGGTANSTTVNTDAKLYVYSGGTAEIVFNPWMDSDCIVSSAGASVTYLERDANAYFGGSKSDKIEKGSSISNMIARSGYGILVYSDGTARSNRIDGGSMNVYSGGTALTNSVSYSGSMNVYSGGIASRNVVSNRGILSLSGGIASRNSALSSGSMNVYSGGTAISNFVSYGGSMNVYSGGTANRTSVFFSGSMNVYSGGTANNNFVSSGGSLNIYSGGTANNNFVSNGGKLYVSSGGTANNTTLDGAKEMIVSRGAVANRTSIFNRGSMTVSDGTANSTTVGIGGFGKLSQSGTMNDLTVRGGGVTVDGGTMNIAAVMGERNYSIGILQTGTITMSRGNMNSVTVGIGGTLDIQGGTVTNIIENGGYVAIINTSLERNVTYLSNSFSGHVGNATVHSGTTANSTTIDGGKMVVYSGGTANCTTVYNGNGLSTGLVLSSGAVANSTMIYQSTTYQRTTLNVGKGVTVNDTVISGGTVGVGNGGVANNTFVSCSKYDRYSDLILNGNLIIMSGGTANHTVVEGIWNSTGLFNSNLSGGNVFVSKGGVANYTSVGSGGRLHISGGGVANDTVVYGYPTVYGPVDDDDEHSGTVEVLGGTANRITVNCGGRLIVSGGRALGIVENGGCVDATPGDNVTFASNTFSGLVLSAPTWLESTGISATVHSGTTAVDVTVMGGGALTIFSGGKLTGRFADLGGRVSATEGAIIDFDLARTTPGAAALICDLSRIEGTPTFTVTIEDGQTEGVYALADGASSFNGTITVVNAAGDDLGTLTVDGTVTVANVDYTLLLSSGALSLKVGETVTPSPYTSDGLTVSGGTVSIVGNEVYHDTLVCSGGDLVAIDDSFADGVTVLPGGSFTIQHASAANIVENGGFVSVGNNTSVTFASNTFSNAVLSNATLHSGTTACDVKLAGDLYIFDGGVVSSVKPTHEYRLNSYGVTVAGGTANDVLLGTNQCSMTVLEGGVVNDTLIITTFRNGDGGRMTVSSGGTANNTLVSGGSMTVSSSGTASVTTVRGGVLFVSSGGTAMEIVEDGGYVEVASGANVTFASHTFDPGGGILGGTATVHSGTTAANIALYGSDALLLYSGGIANNVFVSQTEGYSIDSRFPGVRVFSGGTLNSASLNYSGRGFIYSGGTANDTTVGYLGSMTVLRGGIVNGVTVSEGIMVVSEGAKLTGQIEVFGKRTVISAFGRATLDFDISGLTPEAGARVNDLSLIRGENLVYTLTVSDSQADGTYTLAERVKSFSGTITVQNSLGESLGTFKPGGVIQVGQKYYSLKLAENVLSVTFSDNLPVVSGYLIDTTVNVASGWTYEHSTVCEGGCLCVLSGGKANRTGVSESGSLFVYDGGIANDTNIESGGEMHVCEDGIANNINLTDSGSLYVYTGGIANDTNIESDGKMFVSSDGTANSTTVFYGGSMVVSDGGKANGTIVEGSMVVSDGGTANSTTVFYGDLSVYSGGTANNITVNDSGTIHIYTDGVVNNLSCSDSNIVVYGKLTGQIYFEEGIWVSFENGVLDFDISGLTPEAEARVNDLSVIGGTPLYTLTISDSQADGTYYLAEGAAEFAGTISVVNAMGDVFGSLTVGETVRVGDLNYTLNLTDDTLSVDIAPHTAIYVYTGDFNGDGKDMLAVEDDTMITIYMNGEPWGLGLTLEPGWEYFGTGDFNGDNMDDFLRVSEEGYVVGDMSNGNGTFTPQVLNFLSSGWDILGGGDFNGNGTVDLLIANPTGASETVGLLGYWESGVTWTLINGYSAEWECVEIGDFNGDGKCDMLWRNSFVGEGGLTYNAYCTWIMDPPEGQTDWRMVSVANPDEWDFLCSGDFDGNGTDDIAMINDVGVVGIWGVSDGYLSSWSILSAVNTSEWRLAGVGDFNGDGTDDIAWGNINTGLVGYWQINDKTLTDWQNIATIA